MDRNTHGEGGLVMVTHPFGSAKPFTESGDAWTAGYFNECMSGFEYQVAGHMLREGMVEEGLAIARMVHDRYHPTRRNPYNEIECSDHYARAMASYGVYLAACGFEYHGPHGHIGFAPMVSPDRFRAAFTAAEGWGTFSQERRGRELVASIEIAWGHLRLRSVALKKAGAGSVSVRIELAGQRVAAAATREDDRVIVRLDPEVDLMTGQHLRIRIA